MFCSDVEATATLWHRATAVGATWVASKPGGLNVMEWLQPRKRVHTEVAVWDVAGSRPGCNVGKAVVLWEETGKCTTGTAGVRAQAPGEGFAEITSGRAISQQGLAATCEDPSTEAVTVGDGRDLV